MFLFLPGDSFLMALCDVDLINLKANFNFNKYILWTM